MIEKLIKVFRISASLISSAQRRRHFAKLQQARAPESTSVHFTCLELFQVNRSNVMTHIVVCASSRVRPKREIHERNYTPSDATDDIAFQLRRRRHRLKPILNYIRDLIRQESDTNTFRLIGCLSGWVGDNFIRNSIREYFILLSLLLDARLRVLY